MKWIEDFKESEEFESLLESLFKDRMKSSDDFCKDIWSSLANVIWVNPKEQEQYSASFGYAGGVVSKIIGRGTYMDWYCCGEYSSVSEEIGMALEKLNWIPYGYEGDKLWK